MTKKFLLFFVLQIYSSIFAISLREISKEQIGDGITYTKMHHSNETVLHVVEVNPQRYQLDLCLAENQRDPVSEIAKHNSAIIAVNGANYRRGGPYNGCRLNLLNAPKALCCPGSFYAGALVIDDKNTISFDFCKANPILMFHTTLGDIEVKLDGINIPRVSDKNILYDVSFKNRSIYVDEKVLVIKKTKSKISCFIGKKQNIIIPSIGFVAIVEQNALKPEDVQDVQFKVNLKMQSPQHDCAKTVLCGAGMLLKNGERCDLYKEFSNYQINNHYGDEAAADFGSPEQQTWLIEGCHPRTAIGMKENGNILLLVADGRLNTSVGLTLKEIQDIFLQLDCYDALNIGGGGCSTLVINDRLMNCPSQGQERPVSEALCFSNAYPYSE